MAEILGPHGRATETANLKFDDPSLVIAAAMTAGNQRMRASDEQLVFAWLLSLAPDHDPAVAAGNLVEHYESAGRKAVMPSLLTLLSEVAAYPRERLSRVRAGRRRRRG